MAVAADPLWTNEGQVLWVLEHSAGTDDLASVSAIATELGGQPQAVVSALRKLADSGAVAAHTVGGREVWGTLFYGASALVLIQVAMAVVIVLPGTFWRQRTSAGA
ncbi:hypothetical protein P3H15_42420 [Rhodococcus sp. T2V]|uniref:hypothetical protein n=1 Tax=Rhodococcus sp. T2V TaxID=3034164 RepID=UPI0023E130E1|nr:hypothetical protein [Rhodococcus sp. T2V]MDF3311638.1 hypothetical protein [Rhodococcus sp. T2V]